MDAHLESRVQGEAVRSDLSLDNQWFMPALSCVMVSVSRTHKLARQHTTYRLVWNVALTTLDAFTVAIVARATQHVSRHTTIQCVFSSPQCPA